MKILFVRHGEPCYDNVKRLNLVSYLGELTPRGISQAENVANDNRFLDAEIIISSPYTRALQTASIISRKTQIPLIVDAMFHEWLQDKSHISTLDPTYGKAAYHEFSDNEFEHNSNCVCNWESASELAKRAFEGMNKYYEMGYKKIIVVAHSVFIRTFGYSEPDLKHCEVYEYEFDKNSCYNGIVPWKG